MNRLVIGNLLHRPLRSAISILAVAIEVAMILSIVGIMVGHDRGFPPPDAAALAPISSSAPRMPALSAGVSGAPIPRQGGRCDAQAPARGGRLAGNSAVIRESRGGDHLGHRLCQLQRPASLCLSLRGPVSGSERRHRGRYLRPHRQDTPWWGKRSRSSITPSASAASSSTAKVAANICLSGRWARCWAPRTMPRSSS